MLSCSIWFSAPSFWMGGGYDLHGTIRTVHTTYASAVKTNLRDQVSPHVKISNKTLTFLCPIHIFLGRKLERRRFWKERYETFPEFNFLLISSSLQF